MPKSTVKKLKKLRDLRDKMIDARFQEDLGSLESLEDTKANLEDEIRMGESLLRNYIRSIVQEAYKREQPRLELPLYQDPPKEEEEQKEKKDDKKKSFSPYVDQYVDFYVEEKDSLRALKQLKR